MNSDSQLPAVDEFLAELVRSLAGEDAVSGEPGRRLALMLDRLCRMHRPGAAGRCPDCRVSADGWACGSWAVMAETLAGCEPARVDREFGVLLARFGGQRVDGPTLESDGIVDEEGVNG
jgi:hypothetical protein